MANYALGLSSVYGFNKDVAGGVLNLSDGERNAIFYVSAHTAIIHDLDTGEQQVLQGRRVLQGRQVLVPWGPLVLQGLQVSRGRQVLASWGLLV